MTLAATCLLVCAGDARPVAAAPAGVPIKVSCIGEQTTHSDLFPGNTQDQPVGMQEYPAMLQGLLGSGYNVMNFGDCCASVISGYTASETHPYINGNKFGPSVSFAPDIVVIGSWGRHDWGMSAQNALAAFKAGDTTTDFTKFQTDYDTLVSKYLAITPQPKIFCSTPIPIPFGNDGPDDGYKTSPAAAAVKAVCQKYNLPIIDLFTAFTGHMEYYINPPEKDSEGEHTSVAGMTETAQLVYDAITGADAGGIVLAADSEGGSATGPDGQTGAGEADASLAGSGTGLGADDDGGVAPGSSAASSSASTTGGSSGATGAGSSGPPGTVVTGAPSATTAATSGTNDNPPVQSVTGSSGSTGGGCSTAAGVTASVTWSGAFCTAALGVTLISRRRRRRPPLRET
ncbi:MAG: hypothetical protein ABSF69_01600 [Polyangiaceae bacterium]